ncbi:MAG TPA: signal peptidase II [Solirubrobacteraceae bacterium]|jgi:signal peptidase II|nr:signal peptidase II [Solirubrobacteraceae bacterium]
MAAVDDRPRRDRAPRAWTSRRGRPWALATLVLAIVVALDQLSKRAVEHSITPGEERKVLPGLQLVDTRNHGIAFGFLHGSDAIVTILIGVALIALLAYFALHSSDALIWLPTGMLIGGALGNVIDRIRAGSVTDFIKLPLGWPPFNLADTSITLGVLVLFAVIERARHARA